MSAPPVTSHHGPIDRRLAEGLRTLELDAALAVPLVAYLDELLRWNRAYNLTAIRSRDDMILRHLLDSLVLLPALAELPAVVPQRLLDVGAGAGLPGLVLAIARPDWQVDVLDANGKKARFMRHAVRALGLANVEVIEARAEAYAPAQRYTAVISRAFAALGDFVTTTRHLLADDGHWLAMKGKLDACELERRPEQVEIIESKPLQVPGLDEARHLLVLRRSTTA